MKQRNVQIDDELWNRARVAAARRTIEEGRSVSISELVRRALREKLKKLDESP